MARNRRHAGPPGPAWAAPAGPAVATWAGLLGLAACLAVIGVAFLTGGLQTSADVAQLVSVLLAVPALVVSLLLWWRREVRPAVTPEAVAAAKQTLAALVHQQWRVEATLRSLDHPDPLPVRWRTVADDRLVDHPANRTGSLLRRASSADIAALAGEFRAMRRRRLVILGGTGTGKTTLAVQLVRELLDTRQDHEEEPVPVLLPAAAWDPVAYPLLADWLAVRLTVDYPSLRATGLGPSAAEALAGGGHILPVLDGLDELPPGAQAEVIGALNRSLGGTDQLIVTCRAGDYRRALAAAAAVLTSAVVVEPDPLEPAAVAEHLRRSLPQRPGAAWERILTRLSAAATEAAGPIGALAAVTATPLGVWLLRSVYLTPGSRPADLLDPARIPDAAALRIHLLDRLIPAVIETRPPSARPADLFRPRRRHDPDRMRRRLAYLAHHLTHPRGPDGSPRTRDLAWWRLARDTRAVTGRIRLAAAVAIGAVISVVNVSLVLLTEGRSASLVEGMSYGTGFGLAAGLLVALKARTWARQSPGFADLRLRGPARSAPRLAAGLVRGLLAGLGTGLVMLVAVGLGEGFTIGAQAALATAAATGLTVGLGGAVAAWAEAPTSAGRADTPGASWRADRALNLVRAVTIGLAGGLTSGLVCGTAAGLINTPAFGLQVGGTYALTFGIPAALVTGRHHAWLAYLVATHRLAGAGRLPRRLMPFLDDAHRLGLLRAVGPIYQFRHADLQDHLAATYHAGPRRPARGG